MFLQKECMENDIVEFEDFHIPYENDLVNTLYLLSKFCALSKILILRSLHSIQAQNNRLNSPGALLHRYSYLKLWSVLPRFKPYVMPQEVAYIGLVGHIWNSYG